MPYFAKYRVFQPILVALGAVALGVLTRAALGWLTGIRLPYMPFFPWIAVAGILAGSGSGLLTVVLVTALSVVRMEPTTLVSLHSPLVGLLLFVFGGLLLVGVTAWENRLRRRVQEAAAVLHESEHRLHMALEAGNMGTWQWDVTTGRVVWSPGLERIHGRTPGSFGGTLEDVLCEIVEDDRGRVAGILHDALANRSDYHVEYRIALPDGQHRWLEARGRVDRDAHGIATRMVGICMDVSDRKRAELDAINANRHFQVLTETVPEFVWSCAPSGAVDYINPRYIDYTGVTLQTINSGGWQKIVHPDDVAAIEQLWRDSLNHGTPFEMEYRFRGQGDGQYRWFLTRTVPVRDAGGQVVRWVGAATDIHEAKMAREEREQLLAAERAARQEAERAGRVKDQFLAVLSHELRTPLTPVLLTVALLEASESIPQAVREDIASIRRNIEMEARLIDDLLDLTRVARGKIQYDFRSVDLNVLIRSAISICCNDGKHTVVDDLAATQTLVNGDSARLQQVFCNLLSNAWKFTPPGGTITIKTLNEGRHVCAEIIDTGPGIAPDLLFRVFDAFEQGDSVRARKFGGLGLGLAICKALVEGHHGRITAISPGPGRGAKFRVELPLIRGSTATANPDRVRRGTIATATRKLRMLLVEDHPSTLRALERVLKASGHHVNACSSIADGLRAAAKDPYDLVISDLGLPDGSGYELMRQLRRQHGLRGIALSGYGMEEDVARSRDAGFYDHLVKPIDLPKLHAAIARMAFDRA